MTDKQVIDVTRCIHFNKSDIPDGCTCYWDGECNHDCYYKQLKRKEQECKNVSSELIEANKQVIYLAKQLDQLKKSNEELPKENEKFKQQVCSLRPELKGLIDEACYKHNIETKTYHKKIVEIINNLDKYGQVLVKIKEIAEENCKLCFSVDGFRKPDDCGLCEYAKILQKVNEVIK